LLKFAQKFLLRNVAASPTPARYGTAPKAWGFASTKTYKYITHEVDIAAQRETAK